MTADAEPRQPVTELRLALQRYAALYDFAPIGYCTFDAQGCIQELNLGAAALFQRARALLLGKPLLGVVRGLDYPKFWAFLRSRFETREPGEVELEFTVKDGRQISIRLISAPVTAATGTPVCLCALVDISEQKEAERALLRLNHCGQLLAGMLDRAEILGRIVEEAAALLGDVAAVFNGEHGCEAIFPSKSDRLELWQGRLPRRMRSAVSAALSGQEQLLELNAGERLWTAKAGGIACHSMLATPLRSGSTIWGALVVGSTNPPQHPRANYSLLVTQFIALAGAALERARLFQERAGAVELRDTMVALVSHEVTNALTAIGINVEGLLRNLRAAGPAQAKIAANVEQMDRTNRWARDLLRRLLDVARIESGMLQLDLVPADPAVLASEAIDFVQPAAAERGIRLRLKAARGLLVNVDRLRLQQALANLLLNAIKFTLGDDEIQVSVECDSRRDCVRFTVADHGPGIAPEALPHLFDRFFQAARQRSAGAGLGLAIAKGVVEAHQGRIRVESKTGAGARFFIELPRAR